MPSVPHLLVSVKDAQEAEIAAICGVAVIDFKAPDRGALGMVSLQVLDVTIPALSKKFPDCFLSVACGEVLERQADPVGPLPLTNYFKLGLAGLGESKDWVECWLSVRRRLVNSDAVSPKCIAVAYVDAECANAPPIEAVVAAAIETKCAGVLFDTCHKGAGTLLDFLAPDRLRVLIRQLKQSGLLVAVAGQVGIQQLPELMTVGADLIAVRSAVCDEGNRLSGISAAAIRNFQLQMERLRSNQVKT